MISKKSKIGFILAALAVIVLASFSLIIILKGKYTQRVETSVLALADKQNNIVHLDYAIQLLYDAENNFRIFTLTKDESKADLYTGELAEISELLDSIHLSHQEDVNFERLVLDKKVNTRLLLDAKLYADSLWKLASYYENQMAEIFGKGTIPLSKKEDQRLKVEADTLVIRPPNESEKRQKGLLGRIRDAILNKRDSPFVKPETVKIIHIQKTVADSTDGSQLFPETFIFGDNLWSSLWFKLAASRGGVHQLELEMLQSNESLFGRLKNMLHQLQKQEFVIAEDRSLMLTTNVKEDLRKIDSNAYWTIAVILLLLLMVLWLIWRSYKNSEELVLANREAQNYANLKGAFAATLSHEIRSLAHSINASAEQLTEKQAYARRKEILSQMKQSWDVLLSMTNNILDYTKMERGEFVHQESSFSPVKAIKAVMDSMRVQAERKQLELRAAISIPPDQTVMGNESQLNQILINLIGNAIKFTQQGYIAVEASLQNTDSGEARLMIVVRDTGIGIVKSDIQKIFEEFHQIDQDKGQDIPKGSGLGLAIVKKIIEQQKGKVSVESTPGNGSAFRVEIPYKTSSPVPSQQAASGLEIIDKPVGPTTAIKLAGLIILVVENDTLQRKYLTMLLANEGINALEASNGLEALQLLNHNQVDMVLTDINMPGMNGIELVSQIREHPDPAKASIPVVALTATNTSEEIDRYMQAGMDHYVIKPFTPKELVDILKTSVAGREIR